MVEPLAPRKRCPPSSGTNVGLVDTQPGLPPRHRDHLIVGARQKHIF